MKEQNSNLRGKDIFNYFKKGVSMLKKNKKVDTGDTPFTIQTPEEGRTIIGEQIAIDGAIRGKEDLLIEGSVKGRIEVETHHLTVGARGQVEAEIQAANVTISGRLVGNINAAGKVKITKEADFNGEIKAKSISVEDGAYLKAVIELKREPDKKPVPVAKPEEKPASEPVKEPLALAGKSSKRNG
jgi:cytoskeletal protein CcmA (bactofilin family)